MEGYIGEIRMFAGNFAPKAWTFCAGQIIAIASNTALFSILGTTYGGNGTTTFALPDLRGRTAVGIGQGPGLSTYSAGEVGGIETTKMSMVQMPIHTHVIGGSVVTQPVAIPALNDSATTEEPSSTNFPALSEGASIYANVPTPNAFMGAITATLNTRSVFVVAVGVNAPFSILSPYTATNYIICNFGVFPSRN